MSISQNFPEIRPSLNLDFANVKALDSRVTFARASTATYYGTQTAKAEENLLLQSQTLEIAPWSNSISGTGVVPVVTANDGVAPDGTTTAERIQFSLNGGTASGDISRWRQSVATTSGLPYVLSFYLKSYDGVSTYDIHLVGADGATSSTITVTGTWTRFTVTANGSGGSVLFALGLRGAQSPANSDTADLLVWGAQLEQRSAVTAYTPTTTQPITNYIPVLQTASAGVARFDHNPVTGESLGLLVEEQRTNLVTYSEDFSNAAWTKLNTAVSANQIIAPDGTLTMDKLVASAVSGTHRVSKPVAINGVYTLSVFAKAGEESFLNIWSDSVAYGIAYFDLVNGTVTVTTGTQLASASIKDVGNGLYRCSITTPSLNKTAYFVIGMGNPTSYTGDGYSGIYIWGAQLEAGAFPTSYIPTVASQVTRAIDSASMTGANFSEWYRADEGSVFVEALTFGINASAGSSAVYSFSDGATSNRIRLNRVGGSTLTVDIATSAGAQVAINSTVLNNVFFTNCLAYKFNDSAASTSGGVAVTDTSCLIPVVTQFQLGVLVSTGPMSGYVKKLAYYPQRLTNTQLQALTS